MSIDSASIRTVIQPAKGFFSFRLKELWEYRELLYFLTWRNVKVRYKQTVLGVFWTFLQPVASVVVFTLVFSRIAKLPSDHVPYAMFACTALLPWGFFAQSLSRMGDSIVGHRSMITKIYFPRLFLPLAAALSGLLDFVIAFLVLIGLMIYYRVSPSAAILLFPGFLFLVLIAAVGMGLWLSALNAIYRDFGHLTPFLIQIWFFLTPVVYSLSSVPERWRIIYGLNPMVGLMEGFRWSLLGKQFVSVGVVWEAIPLCIILFCSGFIFFRKMEGLFTDVV